MAESGIHPNSPWYVKLIGDLLERAGITPYYFQELAANPQYRKGLFADSLLNTGFLLAFLPKEGMSLQSGIYHTLHVLILTSSYLGVFCGI